MKAGRFPVDIEEFENVAEELVMVGNFAPLGCETETKLLVVAVDNQDQPLVDAIKDFNASLASTGIVKVANNAAKGVVDLDMVGMLSCTHLRGPEQHRSDVCGFMGLILKRSQDSVWIFSTSVEARVILDPVPGVGRKGLLHFHEAATLDRTGVYASGGFCDLVPPGILPEVEVPGPGVHVVDSNRVKVVEKDERIPEITSRRVDESRVDGIALLNLLSMAMATGLHPSSSAAPV